MISKTKCPRCGSSNIELIDSSLGGYICKDCGYKGNDFKTEKIIGSERK